MWIVRARVAVTTLLALSLTVGCTRPVTHGFWFENPELVRVEALRLDPNAELDAASVDCTPPNESWRRVAADRQLPVDRGELTVWLSPGKLRTPDPAGVELLLDGDQLAPWREGTTLSEPSFLYSPGGFLQAGLYLALARDDTPSAGRLACRQPPPRWASLATALRRGEDLRPEQLIRLERMGADARPAALVPADARLVLDRPAVEAAGASIAVACRNPGSATRIEVTAGVDSRPMVVDPSDRWQSVSIGRASGPIEIVHHGRDADQCFVADPTWLKPADVTPPSVLLVIVDGLRPDVAGDPEVMPYLVERARSSTVFSRARVTAPWTRPSVTSMLTGMAPREHGLVTEAQRQRLSAEVPLLPEVLRRRGYATASFSANPWLGPDLGLARGFGRLTTMQADAEHVLYEARLWIEAQRGPWFAVAFLMDTHHPFRHRPEYDRTSDNPAEPLDVGDTEVSSAYRRDRAMVLSEAAIAKTRGLYLENAARVDQQLGEFFDLLGQRIDDAVVVVTADHGEAFGEHDDFFHGWNLYDELLRVPLLMHVPGRRGSTVDGNVSLRQLTATLADLAMASDHPFPGPPLPFDNGGSASSERQPLFASTRFRDVDLDAVIWRRWKLIGEPRGAHCQLYDLIADPAEEVNLCDQRPQVRALLTQQLESRRGSQVHQPEDAEQADATVDEALRALGYLE